MEQKDYNNVTVLKYLTMSIQGLSCAERFIEDEDERREISRVISILRKQEDKQISRTRIDAAPIEGVAKFDRTKGLVKLHVAAVKDKKDLDK